MQLYFVLASNAADVGHNLERISGEPATTAEAEAAGAPTDSGATANLVWIGIDIAGERVLRVDSASESYWSPLAAAIHGAGDEGRGQADWAKLGRALRIDLVQQATDSVADATVVVLTTEPVDTVETSAYFRELNRHLDLGLLSPQRIVVVVDQGPHTDDHGLAGWRVVSWDELEPTLDELVEESNEDDAADQDDDVQFTVYRPRTVRPGAWHDLLFFAHKTDVIDGEQGSVDPLAEVAQQAQQVLGSDVDHHQITHADAEASLPRGRTITVLPAAPDTSFNPPYRSFVWNEPVHRERFRFQTEAEAGSVVQGEILVLLGSVVIGAVSLRLRVGEAADVDPAVDRAQIYRRVFVSYSHDDFAVVERVTNANTMGDYFVVDRRDLQVGQDWQVRIKDLIEEADVFQLFWSTNAMQSENVEVEWRHALSLDRPSEFIRTVYWERPLPRDEARSLPPPELTRRHFHHLPVASTADGTEPSVPATVIADVAAMTPGPAAPVPQSHPQPVESVAHETDRAGSLPSPTPAPPMAPAPAPYAPSPRPETAGRRRRPPVLAGVASAAVVGFLALFGAGLYSAGDPPEMAGTTLPTIIATGPTEPTTPTIATATTDDDGGTVNITPPSSIVLPELGTGPGGELLAINVLQVRIAPPEDARRWHLDLQRFVDGRSEDEVRRWAEESRFTRVVVNPDTMPAPTSTIGPVLYLQVEDGVVVRAVTAQS